MVSFTATSSDYFKYMSWCLQDNLQVIIYFSNIVMIAFI